MEEYLEILFDGVEKVLNKVVDAIAAGNKKLHIILSLYLITLDESIIEESHPEFKFLFQPITTHFFNTEHLANKLNSLGLCEEDFDEVFDSFISTHKAPAIPDLSLLMKARFLIDLAISGIENFETALESFKREFRQTLIRGYAIDSSPLPNKLKMSLDAEDRAFYEKVKSEESGLFEKYVDPDADRKFLADLKSVIRNRVNQNCAEVEPKLQQRILEIEQERIRFDYISLVDGILSWEESYLNLKWDILPDEIVDKFLNIDLLRPMLKSS